jgi:hypothetical protein
MGCSLLGVMLAMERGMDYVNGTPSAKVLSYESELICGCVIPHAFHAMLRETLL